HLRRALRRTDGDPLTYTDGAGLVGSGVLEGDALLRGAETPVPKPQRPVIAAAPPAQKDRARVLVEKLAELGTLELWWITTRFGEGRPPSPDKARAWSRGGLEPRRSAGLMTVRDGPVEIADLPSGTLFADRSGGRRADLAAAPCVAIGPEAGWAEGEIPTGAPVVALGASVLRVETAAIAAAVLAN